MRRLLIPAFVCLAVLVGLWAYRNASEVRTPELRRTVEAPAPSPATDEPNVRQPVREELVVDAVRDEAQTDRDPQTQPFEPGGLVIEVVDSAGEPVAGVTVELELPAE